MCQHFLKSVLIDVWGHEAVTQLSLVYKKKLLWCVLQFVHESLLIIFIYFFYIYFCAKQIPVSDTTALTLMCIFMLKLFEKKIVISDSKQKFLQ